MNTTPFSTLHFASPPASDQPSPDQDQLQVDAPRRERAAAGRALDIGGGGRAGAGRRRPRKRGRKRTLRIVAGDAHRGDPVVLDRHSGVDLVDAAAASCANGFGVPPYGIGDSRYIDGGYRRSSENADLAAGYGRGLVLSPLGGRTRADRKSVV